MGWTFGNWNKHGLIRHLTEENGVKTIAKTVRGNVLWAVQESAGGEKFIGCYLLGADRGGWGYKDIDESMGPFEINCPLVYLDMVPCPGGRATEWRAKVREKALRDSAIRSAKVGDVIVLRAGCRPQRLRLVSTKPLRARDEAAGNLYRVPLRHIASVESEAFRAFESAQRLGADVEALTTLVKSGT